MNLRMLLLVVTFSSYGPLVMSMKRDRSEDLSVPVRKVIKFSTARLNERLLELCKDGGLLWMNNYFANGADANVRDENGYTCLHYACMNGIYLYAEHLIERGASLEAQAEESFTPLHLAAHNGHVKVCELLVGKGATVEARTNDGFTPLHIAVIFARRDVVVAFLKHGADIQATTQNRRTALDLARQGEHKDIVVYLENYLKQKALQNGIHRVEESADLLEVIEQGNGQRLCELLQTNIYSREELETAFAKAHESENYEMLGLLLLKGPIYDFNIIFDPEKVRVME